MFDTETPSLNPSRRHFLAALSAASFRLSAIGTLGGSVAACKSRGKHHRKHPPCFLRGTRILTSKGEIAVENLLIGDLVPVASGHKPVRWIGRRAYEKTADSWQDEIRPIRISRGAIAPQVPHRDLYLSPPHRLLLGGMLIRAIDLVNGVSIVSEAPPDIERIEYFHILLDTHEVLKAEGAEAETLLMLSADHERFSNFVEYERLFGSQPFVQMTPCAPVHAYGGGRSHLAALLRIAASSCVDVRDPFQREFDRLSARTKRCVG